MATDPSLLSYALVLAVGLIAGLVSGIVGTGATIILLPVLVFAFGPRAAIPIMAVVALMSNFAKITSWWKEIDWRAVGCYALGGIPGAALPRLFTMFSQVDPSLERTQGGLGIGLALVKGLAEMHGGTASVTSAGLQ